MKERFDGVQFSFGFVFGGVIGGIYFLRSYRGDIISWQAIAAGVLVLGLPVGLLA
jgi:hypothetical protein